MTDSVEQLLAAGWIEPDGNDYKLTATGVAALRRGTPGRVPGHKERPIDSVLARAKPAIRKKQHRKAKRHG